MEIFAPVYTWGNDGLKGSRRHTWGHVVSEEQDWARKPCLPLSRGQVSFTLFFCPQEQQPLVKEVLTASRRWLRYRGQRGRIIEKCGWWSGFSILKNYVIKGKFCKGSAEGPILSDIITLHGTVEDAPTETSLRKRRLCVFLGLCLFTQ